MRNRCVRRTRREFRSQQKCPETRISPWIRPPSATWRRGIRSISPRNRRPPIAPPPDSLPDHARSGRSVQRKIENYSLCLIGCLEELNDSIQTPIIRNKLAPPRLHSDFAEVAARQRLFSGDSANSRLVPATDARARLLFTTRSGLSTEHSYWPLTRKKAYSINASGTTCKFDGKRRYSHMLRVAQDSPKWLNGLSGRGLPSHAPAFSALIG